MMFMSPELKTTVECGNCSRLCTGETLCKTIFTNQGKSEGFVAVTPNFPARVVPINLAQYGGKLLAKNGSFLASSGDVSVAASVDCCSCAACCGGLGMVRQSVTGSGTAFLAAGGTVLNKVLQPNEASMQCSL